MPTKEYKWRISNFYHYCIFFSRFCINRYSSTQQSTEVEVGRFLYFHCKLWKLIRKNIRKKLSSIYFLNNFWWETRILNIKIIILFLFYLMSLSCVVEKTFFYYQCQGLIWGSLKVFGQLCMSCCTLRSVPLPSSR